VHIKITPLFLELIIKINKINSKQRKTIKIDKPNPTQEINYKLKNAMNALLNNVFIEYKSLRFG